MQWLSIGLWDCTILPTRCVKMNWLLTGGLIALGLVGRSEPFACPGRKGPVEQGWYQVRVREGVAGTGLASSGGLDVLSGRAADLVDQIWLQSGIAGSKEQAL